AHDLREQVPLRLCKGTQQVSAGNQRVIAPARFLDRAVRHAPGARIQLIDRDVKTLHGHASVWSTVGAPTNSQRAGDALWCARRSSRAEQPTDEDRDAEQSNHD